MLTLTKDQKQRLETLIEIARKRKERIVAVNDDFDAYCPVEGIRFPNHTEEEQRIRDAVVWNRVPQNRLEKVVADVVGSAEDWAKKYADSDQLYEDSFYEMWITSEEEELTDIELSLPDGGNCVCNGIYYENLDLPEDVCPIADPFEVEAKKWQAILGE
jgi:hypothetical protein